MRKKQALSQPHVRPIKRGKAGKDTEFGAKLSLSLVDGFGFVDRISWNNCCLLFTIRIYIVR